MNEILEYLLIILFIGAYAFLLPLILKQIDKEKLAKIIEWAKIFVEAAEQIYGDGYGNDKKDYVMEHLTEKFNFKNIDLAEIDAIIESEVLKLK